MCPRRADGALAIHEFCGKDMLFDFDKWRENRFKNPEVTPYKMSVPFIKELEARGYDLTTLKFQIELKRDVTNEEYKENLEKS